MSKGVPYTSNFRVSFWLCCRFCYRYLFIDHCQQARFCTLCKKSTQSLTPSQVKLARCVLWCVWLSLPYPWGLPSKTFTGALGTKLISFANCTVGEPALLRNWELNQLQWEFQYLIPKPHQSAFPFIVFHFFFFYTTSCMQKKYLTGSKHRKASLYSFEHKGKILLDMNSTQSGHLVM